MIVAVSPNISYDRLVVVRGFRPGHTSRALQIFTHAGGSAVHGAHVIRRMGGESIALGLVGGCTGMLWHKTAERLGIPNDMVEIEGESRVSYCVVDPELGCVVESVEPGPPTEPAALDELLERMDRHLPGAEMLIVSGSLPPGLPDDAYARMIDLARRYGVPTLADIHSEPLRQAARRLPWMIKPNLDEFHGLVGRVTSSLDERARLCRELQGTLSETIALSMSGEGLLLTGPGSQWLLHPPVVDIHLPDGPGINVVGSGDALVGALAYQYCQTGDLLDAAKMGLAAAHANLGTYGISMIDPELVRTLAEQVTAEPL
jgi:1-phosphofructokinase family hexose kinase